MGKVKRAAIICTILGVFLLGGSAAIMASTISGFTARSTENRFSAHVTSSTAYILLSDSNEFREEQVSETFIANEVTYEGDIKFAGNLNVYNASDMPVRLMFKYEDPNGQVNELADDFYVQMRRVYKDGYEIVYSGTLADYVEESFSPFSELPANQEAYYEMYVGLERQFTPEDTETEIEFNFVVNADIPIPVEG